MEEGGSGVFFVKMKRRGRAIEGDIWKTAFYECAGDWEEQITFKRECRTKGQHIWVG